MDTAAQEKWLHVTHTRQTGPEFRGCRDRKNCVILILQFFIKDKMIH